MIVFDHFVGLPFKGLTFCRMQDSLSQSRFTLKFLKDTLYETLASRITKTETACVILCSRTLHTTCIQKQTLAGTHQRNDATSHHPL